MNANACLMQVVHAKNASASTVPRAPESSRLAPITPPGAAPGKAAPTVEPVDAIFELQQALNGASLSSGGPGPAPASAASDPFGASSLGSPPPANYNSQSMNPFKPAPYNPMSGECPMLSKHASESLSCLRGQ